MGGPRGGGKSSSLDSSDPYLAYKFPEDLYASTSCVNCHNPPPAPPPKTKCGTCHSVSPEVYLPRPSPCTAEIYWPPHLQTPIREIQRYPWWVDQNFLSTKMQKGEFPLSVKKADMGITLYLTPNAKMNIGELGLEIGREAFVTSNLPLVGQKRDLNLLLDNQDLFSMSGVGFNFNRWWDSVTPDSWLEGFSVRDGHPILATHLGPLQIFRSHNNPVTSRFDLSEFIFPKLPVAFHEETGKTLNRAEFEALPVDQKRKYHRIEFFYDMASAGRIPERVGADEIYHLMQDLQSAGEKAKAHGLPPTDLGKIEGLIASLALKVGLVPDEIIDRSVYVRFADQDNANLITLDLKTDGLKFLEEGIKGLLRAEAQGKLEIEEIFLPAIAHLGKTKAEFRLNLNQEGRTVAVLDQIDSDIKPIDYLKDNPRKLGWIEVKGGKIQDGKPVFSNGIWFEPGIHLEAERLDLYNLKVNLNLQMSLKLPLLGEVEMTTPLLFSVQIQRGEQETKDAWGDPKKVANYQLVPQTTLISLPSLAFKWTDGLSAHELAGNFLLTDMPSLMKPTLTSSPSTGFWVKMELEKSSFGPLQNGSWELSIPLSQTDDHFYDFGGFGGFPQLSSVLHFKNKDNSQLVGNVVLTSNKVEGGTAHETKFSLNQFDETGVKLLNSLIQDGMFTVTVRSPSSKTEKTDIDFSATAIGFDPVYVNSPKFRVSYSKNQDENGLLDWTIHEFNVSGNTGKVKWPTRGYFRGPFWIKTRPIKGQDLILQYDQNEHRMNIRNLRMGFDFKRVAFPGLYAATGGNVSGLDVDGRVHGFWSMDTESYKGRGRIVFQGDKEGDIHLRNRKGRRLEARLNPDDPDRLYEIPALADTTWTIDRIDGIDTRRERINGHFLLRTLVDWMVLQAFGVSWNEHDEFTFEFDHLPYTAKGFDRKIKEYFLQIEKEQKEAAEEKKP